MAFEVSKHPLIGNRVDLAAVCNCRGLDLAVEIGTDQGAFACSFLEQWHGYQLYCVDPYEKYTEMGWDRGPDLAMALTRLSPFVRRGVSRVRILRTTSAEAAGWAEGSLPPIGFVFIDGPHDIASVAADVQRWWPLVRTGGILAGHDFDEGHPGVMQAVTAFAQSNGLHVWLTRDDNTTPSWFVFKDPS